MSGSFDTSFDSSFDTSSDPPFFDYVAHAIARLPHMYRSSDPTKPTNTEKSIAARLGPANDLGAAMRAVLVQRNIDTAVGAQLTVIGRIVGRKDRHPDDETERRYCRAQISANKSDGVREDLLTIARLVIDDDTATIVGTNYGNGAVSFEISGAAITEDVAAVLTELLIMATSDGVRLIVVYSTAPPATVGRWTTQGTWGSAIWAHGVDKEF